MSDVFNRYSQQIEKIEKIVEENRVEENIELITLFLSDFLAYMPKTTARDTAPVKKLEKIYQGDYIAGIKIVMPIVRGIYNSLTQ